MADETHDRRRYQRGCRCERCCESNRTYARQHKRRRRASLAAVPTPPATEAPVDPADGRVTAAVRAQIAGLPAAEERPGLVEIALALCALLDNQAAVPQHPSAAHRLTEILDALAKSPSARGRLSVVRGMTRPPKLPG